MGQLSALSLSLDPLINRADGINICSKAVRTTSSGVTSKAANGGHIKTGQRKWPGTRLFYSAAS